jgi:heme exporter protein CcmD
MIINSDIHHILSMGGYGIYVWAAYVITLVIFGLNLLVCVVEKKQTHKIIRRHLVDNNES